jgi:hypothetical protein
MGGNPVGNQIRRLDAALEAERKDKQTLLLALETKAPEVFAEYMRLKEEAEERVIASQRAAQLAEQRGSNQRFQPSAPRGTNSGNRF